MSIFFICIIACIAFGFFTRSARRAGTICHESPNRSFSHPHWTSLPPADSFSQYSSTSCCESQRTVSEIASVNLNDGPPLRAVNFWPIEFEGDRQDAPVRLAQLVERARILKTET